MLEGAKKLADAGFKDVNKDGFVDTHLVSLRTNDPIAKWLTDFNNTVQLAVEQLNEIGIKGKLVRLTSVYNQAMLKVHTT